MKKSIFNLCKGKEPLKVIRGGVFAIMLCALVCAAGSCKVGLGDSVDTKAPSVKIVYPDPNTNAIIRDTFILYGDCDDDKQITAVKVTLVNKLTGETVLEDAPATVDSSSKHWRIDLNKYSPENRYAGWQLADGTYSATVRAYDGSHDSSSDENSSDSSTFDIDNTPPVFVIKNPGVVKSGSSSPSAYGSIFTIEGTIAELHSVSSMDVTIYDESGSIVSKENYNGEEISSFREENIETAGGTSVIIAQAGSARYDGIYGDSSGTQKYTCSIKLTDNAKKYVAPPESSDQRTAEEAAADEKGNSTSSLYLYDDVYETLLSQKKDTSKKLQPTDLMNILNGTKSDDEARQILARAEKDTSSAEESGRLYFSLNPNANPTYQVNGFEYKFGANATNQQASSGNAVSVTVTQGLDQTQIDLDGNEKSNATVKVWMKEYTASPESKEELAAELSETLAKKVRALEDDRDGYSDSTFTEYSKATDSLPATEIEGWKLIYDYGKNNTGGASVSTKTFSVTLPEGSIVLNKYYMLAVTGRDIDGVEFAQNTIYGFLGNEAGVPPTLKILSPGSSSLQATTGFSFSGSAVLTGGSLYASYLRATLSVTDQDTNADLGTYTEEISRAGADKGWTSTAAFTCAEDGSWTFSPSGLEGYEKIKAEKGSGKSYLYTLELYGKSSSGHDSSVSQNVQIDSKKPSVGISSITPTVDEYKGETGPFVNGTVTVKGSVEETNLESVVMEVYAEDGLKETRNLGKVYSFSQAIDTTALPDEVLLDVRVTATDKVGNTATYSSRSAKDSEYTSLKISQKTDNPVITLNNASIEGFTENAGSIGTEKGNLFGVISNNKISVSVSDDDLIKSVTMKVYNENGEEIASTTPPGEIGKSTYSNSFPLPSAEGVYKVEVIATDDILSTELSGEREAKTTSTGKFYVAVSAGAPAITLDSVKTYLTATPSFTGTVSSTKSTVKAEFTKANIDGKDADEKKLSEYNAMLSQPEKGTARWTVSFIDGNSLDNGKYTVRFTASNDYGESNSTEAEFTVDDEAPTVKITEYNSVKSENTDGFTSEQIFYLNPENIKTIKGTCSDNIKDGIDSVYYYVGDITGKLTPSTENGWLLANLTKTDSETGWTVSLTDLGSLTDGEKYPVHIKATDKAGNISDDYAYISLYIDKTGPVLTASVPDSGLIYKKDEKTYRVYGSNSFNVSVTAEDVAGVASVSANSTSLKGADGIYTGTVSVTPDSDGFASISVVATDSVGNASEKTIDDIMVDLTAPTLAISSYPENATKDGFTLSGTVADNIGVKSVVITDSLDSLKSYEAAVSGDTWSVTLKPSAKGEGADETKDGSHTYTVTAKDKVGNTSTATCRVTTDTTAPYWYTGNTENKEPYISTKASTEKITVSGVEHDLYGSNSLTVAAKAKDETTNVSNLKYNLNDEKDSSSAVVWKTVDNGNITVENLAQGLNTLKIKAVDEAGNETSEVAISFFVDSLAPAEPALKSVDSDSDTSSMADFAAQNKQKLVNGKEDVTFTLEAADDTSGGENSYSGIASVELTKIGNKTLSKAISGTLVSEENGKSVYSITIPAVELASGSANVTVKDKAGNATTLGMFNFLLDDKAPAVSMSSPAGDVNKTISLSASATDNQEIDGATLKLEYSADKTAWTELSSVNAGSEYKAVILDSVISVTGFDTTKFADKSTVYVRAVISDKAKNEGKSEEIALRINQDSDRPVVKIDNLSRLGDGTFILKYGTNAQITGTLSDDDSTSGAVVEEFVISESPYNGSGSVENLAKKFDPTTGDFTFEPENTEDGEKTLYFYIKDNGGNEFYTTASTGADSGGSTTYLKNPKLYLKTEQLPDSLAVSAFTYKSDSNSPTVTAGKGVLYSDNAGEKVAKDANGEDFDFAKSNSTLNTSFVAGGSERRFVKFQFEANDASGIEGMTLELFDETNNSVLKLKTPEISASGFTTSGTIEQKQNDKTKKIDPTTSIWTTEIIDLEGKTTAQYTAKIVPYDKAGLVGNGSYSFFIDNAAPEIVIRSPISGKEVTGTVSIVGTATDTGSSGTANIQWLIPKKEFVTVANTKTGTEKLEYLKSLNWNGGEDALAATATLTSWQFDFDGKNDDVISDPANFIFKGGNPALDVYDSDVFATNVTDGIYALPVYFMATDAIGNYSIYTEYALRHNPDGDKPKLDFLYPTVSDYGKDKDGKDLEYVVLGGTIRATGSAVIPSGTTTVRSVYYQIAGEEGSFSDSDKTAASTNYGYTVLTAYDVVKEITGTDYSPTSRTIDVSMLKKFGFSTKDEMNAWWGIKANGTAAWNIILNERGELNPKTNGSTTNIKIRTCGINAEGKFGAWTSGDNVISIHIDDKAPVINSIVKQYKDKITSNPTELPAYTASQNYVSDMFLRGQWYLEVTLLDETAVTSYSVQKDTSTLTAGREYFVQSNVEDTSINKNGYRLYIPIDKNSDSVSYTITANDAEHTATQTFSFKLDNTAPTLESLTGNGQDLAKSGIIEDSNYVYTVGGKSEDSGSGVERVLFYFMRKSGTTKTTIANEVLLDPMITTGTDDSKIALSTLTELPVKQGEHTFYLYAKEQTLNATKDTFTLESADSHIRTGGLIYIDGLYRKITKLDGTTATFEPAMSEAKASVTAYFPIAQVIDNTATEKVKSNSANPFTFESGDDGDGMPETFSKTGTTWTWDATIHSYNMPDGPVTLVMLAFDAAGNVNGTSFNLTIANNAPRLAKVWLGTDLNGDGKYTSDSTLEEIVEYNILNAEGIEQKTYTLDFTETVSDKDSTLKYPAGKFTIKNGLAVIPEFTGGNGTIGMIPKLNATDTTATTGTVTEASASDTTSTTEEKTLGDSAGKFSAQKLTANSKNNSVYGFVMDKNELGSDTEEKRISFTFWDKTEETTQGTDSQYSVLFVKNFVLEQLDSKSPVVRVNPFYWNSASSNSLYENSLKNGHIELEADLPNTFTDSGSTSKDRDPKVSGKIVFTGTAYDNHGLSSISFSYGSLSNVVGATYDATNKKWSNKGTLSTDGYEFKVYDAIPEDANFKTDTAYFKQSGHKIYWTLAIDTENTNVISTIAAADISLTVLATDSNSNTTNATAATTVDDDASYNKPVYKTDVVPYIAGIKTNLSSLKKNNSSVYDRTALGHYPVSSSETIYVYGFNINGGDLKDSSSNTTSLTKIDDATTQELKWYSSKSAPSGSVYKTGSIKEFKSGKISVIVNNISSLNNENADNSRGNYEKENSTKTGDYSIYQNYYNRQPNNDSNNRLTDDVILDVWEFNSTAARPISGLITDPVMKISPTSGMIGFAFTNGPLYFSMPGTVSGNVRNYNSAGEYSYFYWQGSYDFMSSVALTYDSIGHTYGASAGGDINSTQADRFSFMTDRWGVSGEATAGSYNGSNALRLEAIAQYGDSAGIGTGTLNFDKNRVKSPSYATARSSNSTNIYLAYYDDLNEEIRFRYGNLSDNSGKANFDNFNDAYRNNTMTSWENLNNGKYSTAYVQVVADANGNCLGNAGEYVSIGVIQAGSTNGQAKSDTVVMVWYDSINNELKYTYNTNPTAGTTGKNKTNWNDAITLLSEAGEYCQLAVDAAGGIHIAAYDGSNADLKYVYIDKYDNAANAKSCTVDSYGILGQNITIDVAYNGTYYEPHIGYYALSSTKPKYARLTSAEISDGVKEDAYTGVWECSIVPTSSRAFQDRINVGVWKDSSGKIKESTRGTSSADQYWGKCYGNGTSNTVLGYAIKKSSSEGYIETAQMR
ncbi:hypothetical protein [uncultured Treponema sp.]|uniref:hypothetical protein n=1 Tax=uncultured Treponema sp. TaxID=162155 RepID=UPI00258F979A|nr:hypothetical protein [uncultured Treponema sp.]